MKAGTPLWRRLVLALLAVLASLAAAELGLRLLFRGEIESQLASRRAGDPEATRRVLCVGDSYTFGLYYRVEESYPARLEEMLNRGFQERWAVVNAGVPAQNTTQVGHALPAQLRRFRPEVVVILSGHNDRWNLADPGRQPALRRGFEELVLVRLLRLAAAGDFEDPPDRLTAFGEREVGVTIAGEDSVVQVEKAADRLSDEALRQKLLERFREISRLCRQEGVEPVFATYPSPESGYEAPARATRDVCAEGGGLLVDFRAHFASLLGALEYQELLLPGDRHPTDLGYYHMARYLVKRLLESGLLEPGEEAFSGPVLVYPTALERDLSGRFRVRGPPGAEYRVYLGGSSEPPQEFGSVLLPVAEDSTFRRFFEDPALSGRLDDAGTARVALPEDFSKSGGVAAAVVFHDRKIQVPELLVRGVSEAIAIRRAP